MIPLSDTMKTTAEQFIGAVKNAFGDALRSVILYGPAARGMTLKRPYITFLVIVDDNTPSEIARCSQYMKRWNRKRIAAPLFLEPGNIERSLDTFPLEFLDMTSAYHVVYGEDVLKDVRVKKSDVRNQCERELKGKLLHLRAEYLTLRGNTVGIRDLIERTLITFLLVFAGALFLKDRTVPFDMGELLAATAGEYGLDAALFERLFGIARGRLKLNKQESDALFDRYVEELDKLSQSFDSISLTEE